MQVLTSPQVRQLQLSIRAAYDALVIVEDAFCHTLDRLLVALTSPVAIGAYRFTGLMIYHTFMLVCAACYYAGVGSRYLVVAFMAWWQSRYVASREIVSEARFSEPKDVENRLMLLAPAQERRHNCTKAIVNNVLITPAPEAKRRRKSKAVATTLAASAKRHEPTVDTGAKPKSSRGRKTKTVV